MRSIEQIINDAEGKDGSYDIISYEDTYGTGEKIIVDHSIKMNQEGINDLRYYGPVEFTPDGVNIFRTRFDQGITNYVVEMIRPFRNASKLDDIDRAVKNLMEDYRDRTVDLYEGIRSEDDDDENDYGDYYAGDDGIDYEDYVDVSDYEDLEEQEGLYDEE